ncbi:MAG: FtsX-like permease family protein [Acidobacteriota bacterium]|jgi:hypothetical protein
MVLLVGGTQLVRSYVNLWSQDTGFSGNVGLVSVSYPRGELAPRLAEEINATVEQLKRIRGVTNAGAMAAPLLDNNSVMGGPAIRVAGRTFLLNPSQVTFGFFEAVGARLRAGRLLGPNDHGWNAVVVNEAMVQWLWPTAPVESAIGQVGEADSGSIMQIVGVVQDNYDRSLDRKPGPRLYQPIEEPSAFLPVNYLLRLRERSTGFGAAARHAIAVVNADAVVTEAGLLADRLAGTVKARSFAALILSLFTVAGLGITASGLFGIVAFVVARRTREIAIRKAVGAQSHHILWVVVRETVTAAALGSAGRCLVGRWLSKFLQSQLYGITPGDAGSLVGAALVMILVVAIASWIPAKRALRLSTTEALRVE